MQLDFLRQQKPGFVTIGDEIELSDCEAEQSGNWTIADLDGETGEATLIGNGSKQGYISSIHLGRAA